MQPPDRSCILAQVVCSLNLVLTDEDGTKLDVLHSPDIQVKTRVVTKYVEGKISRNSNSLFRKYTHEMRDISRKGFFSVFGKIFLILVKCFHFFHKIFLLHISNFIGKPLKKEIIRSF
jgi:hypothetical protein